MPNAKNKMPIRTHKEARREGGKEGASNWRCDKTPSQNASEETLPRCVDASWWQLNAWPAHCQRLPQVESRLVAAAAAGTQWQPQITPKYGATQRNASNRIDCRFISIRCVSIYLSPVVGNWNCISQRLLSASSTSASTSFSSSTSPLLLQLQRFIVLCFLLLSLSLFLGLSFHSALLSLGPSPQVIIVNN